MFVRKKKKKTTKKLGDKEKNQWSEKGKEGRKKIHPSFPEQLVVGGGEPHKKERKSRETGELLSLKKREVEIL